MTKFDIINWFCRIVALVGMASAGLALLVGVLATSLPSRPLAYATNLPGSALSLAAHLFLWLFTEGISSALTGEDKYRGALMSRHDLGGLLLTCVGIWLLVHGFIVASQPMITLLYMLYSKSSFIFIQYRLMLPTVAIGIGEAVVGLVLVFGPPFLHSNRSQ